MAENLANIIQLTDTENNILYPITSSDCVGMKNGSGDLDSALGKLVPEVEADNKLYARTKPNEGVPGKWKEIHMGIPEAPYDGKIYGRTKASSDSPGKWVEVTGGGGGGELSPVPKNGKLYGRMYDFELGSDVWELIEGISDEFINNQFDKKTE